MCVTIAAVVVVEPFHLIVVEQPAVYHRGVDGAERERFHTQKIAEGYVAVARARA